LMVFDQTPTSDSGAVHQQPPSDSASGGGPGRGRNDPVQRVPLAGNTLIYSRIVVISVPAMQAAAIAACLFHSMVAPIGPLATTSCEPRQARKGAAAAVASGAGVRRVGVATLFKTPESRHRVSIPWVL